MKFAVVPGREREAPAIAADTYDEAVTKIKNELRKIAMYFIRVLEDKAHILDLTAIPYTESDAVKDAAIFARCLVARGTELRSGTRRSAPIEGQ